MLPATTGQPGDQANRKAAEQALASNLQSPIAASGCPNLQQYNVWLQAHFQMLASSIAAEHADAVSASYSTPSPAAFLHSPLRSTEYQTSFSSASDFSPPVPTADDGTSARSYLSTSSALPQAYGLPSPFPQHQPFLQTDYSPEMYSPDLNPNLSPVSTLPQFPAWSHSSVSSDPGSFTFSDNTEYRHSGTDCSALELQDRLCKLCQTATGNLQPEQSAFLGQPYRQCVGAPLLS